MQYISTRGGAEPVDFVTACLAGLAPDGGLYTPLQWPTIEPAKPGEPYVELSARILSAFAGGAMAEHEILGICRAAYDSFAHEAVTPLTQWTADRWILELHHGPTLAFKDVAMQFIGRFYDRVLGERGQRMTILCATSGDTGGAAAFAFAGAKNVDLFILHPYGRVSPVQRLFMTTTGAGNVYNLALQGDFDDCQAIVKSLFADKAFASEVSLSGVNSINWARIAAQTAYFAFAQGALGHDRPLRFVVPSGNMGDALAGHVARRCGLLHADTEIVCAVNENKALVDVLGEGQLSKVAAMATPSPAMDISVPSNLERLIFDLLDGDAAAVRAFYASYAQSGQAELPEKARAAIAWLGLSGDVVSNSDTLEEMVAFLNDTDTDICPHTAVGTRVSRRLEGKDNRPSVILSTAHAAKFPETVLQATGRDAPLPSRCAGLEGRQEHFEQFPADLAAIRQRILAVRG